MSERPSWASVALYTTVAIGLGVGIYFLSKDYDVSLDLNDKHKLENLHLLLNELHLEYTCIYTRYYNLLLKLKDQNRVNPKVKNQIEQDLLKDLAQKNGQICESIETDRDKFKEGLTVKGLEQWTAHFKNDPEVRRLAQNIKKLHEDVFTRENIDQIAFELPEKLDKQMYIKIYRKIWATIRHDLWARIQQEKKTQNTANLSEDTFNKLYSEVHASFETVRMEIYSKLMGEDVERWEARSCMQKAYITYATLSQIHTPGSAVRSRWADLINEAAQQHGEYIEQFSKGQFYKNIEEDPRDTVESDEKISLANFSNYGLSKQKTLAPQGVKQAEKEMGEQAEIHVKRIAQLVMNKVLKIRERKTEAAAIDAQPVQA